MLPAIDAHIPIFIRNTFNPEGGGTRIFETNERTVERKSIIAGFSTVENVAIVNVEGTGMIGVSGITQQIFTVLNNTAVPVKMVAQCSSEHSICFAVDAGDAAAAKRSLDEAFSREIAQGHIHAVTIIEDMSIVAAVGDGMAHTHGVAGRFFNALGNARINIVAIAQGCDERNISTVVSAQDTERALRAIHSSFLLSEITVSVGIIFGDADVAPVTGRAGGALSTARSSRGLPAGAGDFDADSHIGMALLTLLLERRKWLQTRFESDIRVRGIMTKSHMLLSDEPLKSPQQAMEAMAGASDFEQFADHIRTDQLPHSLIVDCSNDPAIASRHAAWLREGIHVVTANIAALAGSIDDYDQIRNERKTGESYYGFETAIGGGVPVLSVLKPLLHGGDSINYIEGCLSSTLSYIFGRLSPKDTGSTGVRFSEALEEARAQGLMETDPMDDILGKVLCA
mmetsp:Transcript_37719/g.102632  ORF Transcript_37719/g.102632 Transcript_37719/m.102632 type:complete len:455 (+) Transcript_37719:1083-2447(+)